MATRPTVYGYSSERDFRRVAKAVRVVERLELRPKRGRNRGHAPPLFVAITQGFSGSTWNKDTAEDENTTITVYPFFRKSGTTKNTINKKATASAIVGLDLESDVTVASGKYKKGIVIDGVLMQVGCKERDLPTGWDD